jgi:hypothetical protein
MIVTPLPDSTSPALFARTNDAAVAARGRVTDASGAALAGVVTAPAMIPPGFSLWDFYAAKRVYRGLEFIGAVDN